MTEKTGSLEFSPDRIIEWSVNGTSLLITERKPFPGYPGVEMSREVCVIPLEALKAALMCMSEEIARMHIMERLYSPNNPPRS